MIFTFLSNGSPPPGYLSNLTFVQRGVGAQAAWSIEPDGSPSIIGDPEARTEAHTTFYVFLGRSVDVSIRSPKPFPHFRGI